MFVPFVFTLDPANDNYYLWIFYKFLNMAKRYNWPIIAQEKYFTEQPTFIESGFAETNAEVAENFEYDVPTLDDMYKIQQYPILKYVEENLINEFGSQTAAWLYLVNKRSKSLEECICTILDDIIEENKDNIEGIFTFCDIPSLTYIAEQRNIPVFQFEWGPFRGPVYRKTAYMNFGGRVNVKNDLENRYGQFIKEVEENPVRFLSRKEILSMFLDYKFINNINLLDCKPQYEMGIACTYTMDLIMFANSSFLNNLELITMVKRYYNENVLAIRFHPGDPAKANPSNHLVDNSATPMEFINHCKRIAVVSSNMAFEAMLWGRTAYVLGNSPYAFKSQRDLSIVDESIVDLEFVNYVTFAYLIPYELMLDVEYLRWRLTNPTELEIYNYNLNYYLSCRGIEPNILDENGTERLRKMLLVQGFDLSGKCVTNNDNTDLCVNTTDNEFSNSIELNRKIQYLENKVILLNMKYKEMEATYKNQVEESSKLWNVHQLLVKEHACKCSEYDKLVEESSKLWEVHQSLVHDSNKLWQTHQGLVDENLRNLDNLKNIKQQYDTILNSVSWKITAPIRYFLDKIKSK